MASTIPLPYWQVNVPHESREAQCPPFLASLNTKDLAIISTPDELYHILTWPEVQSVIARNRLDIFQRKPSDLRLVLAFYHDLKQKWGSVMEFVLTQRIKWSLPITAKAGPFGDGSDIRILWNDWPYGIDPKIVHLVVWTKFVLEDDEETQDLTVKARKEIDDFVQKTFVTRVGKDSVIWFKNFAYLRSVRAVEHFHVMLYDPDPDFIDEVTNGDVPLFKKV